MGVAWSSRACAKTAPRAHYKTARLSAHCIFLCLSVNSVIRGKYFNRTRTPRCRVQKKETLKMRRYLFVAIALALVVVALATHKKGVMEQFDDVCALNIHNILVETDGGECSGEIPVLSCFGRCQSNAYPKFYTSL